MATNKELQDFYVKIHTELKVEHRNKNFIIEERNEKSLIKKIYIKDNEEICIIRQKENSCKALQELFQDGNLKSCDFIVITNKNREFKIYFCEIKSSQYNIEKAEKQSKSSKIFLKYLVEAYNLNFSKDLNFDIDNADEIIISPKFSTSQKRHTNNSKNLINKEIVPNNGLYCINSVKDFFDYN